MAKAKSSRSEITSEKSKQTRAKRVVLRKTDQPKIARELSHSLASFVRDDCDDYTQFLAMVKAGASPAAAAACFRIDDCTWRNWWTRFQGGDKNPLIRKFGKDLLQACGTASAVAEMTTAKQNPEGFSKSPTRRMISNDYSPVDPNAVLPTSQNITNNVLVLSSEVQRDALKCLESAGVITVRRTADIVDPS